MRCNFQRFTLLLQPPDYTYWLRNVTLKLIEGFLRWYLENHHTVDDAELVEDRIRSLELRLALHKLNVPKPLQKRIKFNDSSAGEPPKVIIPMKSKSGL
ncbi:uncharacterized protein ACHE_40830S [Aspergillus chevalieri]|uniref:Uncharacterized protein n=1 Tax=Aspergillus chevalieri TaxID=182096 RepID=A0A7R7ZP54_ASPCH|nr:uncharacterized protein ACHE_40830S [Aspergillus chevalieri]BCR88266.1 hypothetical protein ACHE_40830S [Aspergillus chevalieri]